MECIEKFKGMQDCFRAHPEEYGEELAREEEEQEVGREVEKQKEEGLLATRATGSEDDFGASGGKKEVEVDDRREDKSGKEKAPLPGDEGGHLVPKASHDAR